MTQLLQILHQTQILTCCDRNGKHENLFLFNEIVLSHTASWCNHNTTLYIAAIGQSGCRRVKCTKVNQEFASFDMHSKIFDNSLSINVKNIPIWIKFYNNLEADQTLWSYVNYNLYRTKSDNKSCALKSLQYNIVGLLLILCHMMQSIVRKSTQFSTYDFCTLMYTFM